MSDWWNQPAGRPEVPEVSDTSTPTCHWCGAPATTPAETCAGCGASLSQVEEIKGMAIPGVTVIDPEVLRKGARSTGGGPGTDMSRATAMRLGGSVGGLTGSLAVGAAFIVAEKMKARNAPTPDPAQVGKPSEAASFAASVAAADRALAPTQPPTAPADGATEDATGPQGPEPPWPDTPWPESENPE